MCASAAVISPRVQCAQSYEKATMTGSRGPGSAVTNLKLHLHPPLRKMTSNLRLRFEQTNSTAVSGSLHIQQRPHRGQTCRWRSKRPGLQIPCTRFAVAWPGDDVALGAGYAAQMIRRNVCLEGFAARQSRLWCCGGCDGDAGVVGRCYTRLGRRRCGAQCLLDQLCRCVFCVAMHQRPCHPLMPRKFDRQLVCGIYMSSLGEIGGTLIVGDACASGGQSMQVLPSLFVDAWWMLLMQAVPKQGFLSSCHLSRGRGMRLQMFGETATSNT
jgi:hypothetical protein